MQLFHCYARFWTVIEDSVLAKPYCISILLLLKYPALSRFLPSIYPALVGGKGSVPLHFKCIILIHILVYILTTHIVVCIIRVLSRKSEVKNEAGNQKWFFCYALIIALQVENFRAKLDRANGKAYYGFLTCETPF